jgi:hypothetical protein
MHTKLHKERCVSNPRYPCTTTTATTTKNPQRLGLIAHRNCVFCWSFAQREFEELKQSNLTRGRSIQSLHQRNSVIIARQQSTEIPQRTSDSRNGPGAFQHEVVQVYVSHPRNTTTGHHSSRFGQFQSCLSNVRLIG